jgi:hypothetical protein
MTDFYNGFQPNETFGSKFNATQFQIQQLLSQVRTAIPVQVQSCTNDGGLAPFGFVNVLPLINQVDGQMNMTSHGIIHKVPYCRLQGGANAIIIDPQAGDIGIMIVADRDISTLINTQAQANPATFRQFDLSDGMYIGGILNAQPTQYIQFNDSGITIFSPNNITAQTTGNVTVIAGGNADVTASESAAVTAPTITLTGTTTVDGTLTVTGMVSMEANASVTGSMMNNGVDIGSTHAHPVDNIQGGDDSVETGPPNE